MNTATKYGNYCALITITLILILHYSGVSSFWVKGASSLISSFTELLFIFLAIYFTREKEFGGYIDFKNAAKAGITMILVNAILFSFFQYIYYQFIDPAFMSNFLPEYEKWSKLMNKSDEEIKKVSDVLSKDFTPISTAWSSFSQLLFIETFIALIFARILRRNRPEATP
jgi:hypothetical protein